MGIERGISDAELRQGKDENVPIRNPELNSALGMFSKVHDPSV